LFKFGSDLVADNGTLPVSVSTWRRYLLSLVPYSLGHSSFCVHWLKAADCVVTVYMISFICQEPIHSTVCGLRQVHCATVVVYFLYCGILFCDDFHWKCIEIVANAVEIQNKSLSSLVRWRSVWCYLHFLLSAGTCSWWSISPAHRVLSSKPSGCCRSMGQADGQTDARPFHIPCSVYCAGSISGRLCPNDLLVLMSGVWTAWFIML